MRLLTRARHNAPRVCTSVLFIIIGVTCRIFCTLSYVIFQRIPCKIYTGCPYRYTVGDIPSVKHCPKSTLLSMKTSWSGYGRLASFFLTKCEKSSMHKALVGWPHGETVTRLVSCLELFWNTKGMETDFSAYRGTGHNRDRYTIIEIFNTVIVPRVARFITLSPAYNRAIVERKAQGVSPFHLAWQLKLAMPASPQLLGRKHICSMT